MAQGSKPKNNKSLNILIGLLIAAVLAFAAFSIFQAKKTTIQPPPKKQAESSATKQTVPQSSREPTEEIALPAQLKEKTSADQAMEPCQKISNDISSFFTKLNGRDYVKDFQLKEGALNHFSGLAQKVLANPPTVIRETDNLFTILNNMTHFFRVLGKDNILLIREILANERDDIEDIFALFYQWSELKQQCRENEKKPSETTLKIALPLEGLYEYAGFFLNTMGGQSYIFRRDIRIRLLVRYYSILILDRANTHEINRYGIDIRQPLNSLTREIEASHNLLTDKKTYLSNLYNLREKYRKLYGKDSGA